MSGLETVVQQCYYGTRCKNYSGIYFTKSGGELHERFDKQILCKILTQK